MKLVLFKFFLACFVGALTLVLAELLLRMLPLPQVRFLSAFKSPPPQTWTDPTWGNPGGKAYRRHPVLGYEHAPNVEIAVATGEHAHGTFRFRTNNLGLRRNSETLVVKPSDLFRILLLGDSQTDGYVDNEETFSSILESTIGQPRPVGTKIEVLNAGVTGYSPAQEFLWYKVHAIELKPDLVVVIFYVGNDVVEMRDPSKPLVNLTTGRAIPPREAATRDGPVGPGRFASKSRMDELHLVQLARYAIQAGPLAELWRKLGLYGSLTEIGAFEMGNLINVLRVCHGCFWQSLLQAVHARRNPKEFWEDVHAVAKLFNRLNSSLQADRSRLAVVVLPTRFQVEPSRARSELHNVAGLLGLNEFDLTLDDAVARAILDQLGSAGVTTISLQEPLRNAARSVQLYYSRDWHLNPLGHRAVASALQQELAKKGLVPQPKRH